MMHQALTPHFTSTIPSLHDGTPLSFRIYHPNGFLKSGARNPRVQSVQIRKKGIIVAHPYAPLGGCNDDRIVGLAVEEFLQAGWVVGTFNFRGAHGSKGRTSWSGKPELEDYASFAGFFIHYLSWLKFPSLRLEHDCLSASISGYEDMPATGQAEALPLLILGGYSYGALIVKHLPPLPSLLHSFASPMKDSAADKILACALDLSNQISHDWAEDADRTAGKHGIQGAKLGPTIRGSHDSTMETRRHSRDVRRSFDIKRYVDSKTKLLHAKGNDHDEQFPCQPSLDPTIQMRNVAIPQVQYLLISTPLAPASTLLAPGLASQHFWTRSTDKPSKNLLAMQDTLIVYGDQDTFGPAKKVREWVNRLRSVPGSKVESVEVKGAGHFWLEKVGADSVPVEHELRSTLRACAAGGDEL